MTAVATAVIGSAVVGAAASSHAAGKAADAQQDASAAGILQQQGALSQVRNLLNPYVQAGSSTFDAKAYLAANPDVAADPYYGQHPEDHYLTHGQQEGRQAFYTKPGSLEAQQDLLGLNGTAAQQTAVSGIENSPYFSGLVKQGENAILQNASATGGLRGGNTQAALAQFRPNMLASAIQQQYQNLGGLTNMAQNSAAGVGSAGMSSANQISGLQQQYGAAQAGNALMQGSAVVNGINGINSAFGANAALSGGSGANNSLYGTPYGAGGLTYGGGGSTLANPAGSSGGNFFGLGF